MCGIFWYNIWSVMSSGMSLAHLPIYAPVNWVRIGSDNGLAPIRRQAIISTNAGLLSIGPFGTNFSEILITIQNFSFTKSICKYRLWNGGHFVQGWWVNTFILLAILARIAKNIDYAFALMTVGKIRKDNSTKLTAWRIKIRFTAYANSAYFI